MFLVGLSQEKHSCLDSSDYVHQTPVDKGTPYEFSDAEQLLHDFLQPVKALSIIWISEMNTILNVSIMPREQYQQRLLDIAGGRYKPKPNEPNEPKIWFSSIKSLSAVLSDHNVSLLKMIREQHPENLKILSEISGRQVSNLSRTLKTLERYGTVELQKKQRMVSLWLRQRSLLSNTEFSCGN